MKEIATLGAATFVKALAPCTFCALLLLGGTAAADSKCQDFTIEVDNDFEVNGDPKDIKVVDLRYYDYEDSRWRPEALTDKVVSFHVEVEEWKKNLEYVGGEDIVLELSFVVDDGGGWGPVQTIQSSRFRCIDGDTYRVTVQ